MQAYSNNGLSCEQKAQALRATKVCSYLAECQSNAKGIYGFTAANLDLERRSASRAISVHITPFQTSRKTCV